MTVSSVYGSDDDDDMLLPSQLCDEELVAISPMPPTAPLRPSPKKHATMPGSVAHVAAPAETCAVANGEEVSDLRIRALEQAFVQNQAMLQSVATELAVLRKGSGRSVDGVAIDRDAGPSGHSAKRHPSTFHD